MSQSARHGRGPVRFVARALGACLLLALLAATLSMPRASARQPSAHARERALPELRLDRATMDRWTKAILDAPGLTSDERAILTDGMPAVLKAESGSERFLIAAEDGQPGAVSQILKLRGSSDDLSKLIGTLRDERISPKLRERLGQPPYRALDLPPINIGGNTPIIPLKPKFTDADRLRAALEENAKLRHEIEVLSAHIKELREALDDCKAKKPGAHSQAPAPAFAIVQARWQPKQSEPAANAEVDQILREAEARSRNAASEAQTPSIPPKFDGGLSAWDRIALQLGLSIAVLLFGVFLFLIQRSIFKSSRIPWDNTLILKTHCLALILVSGIFLIVAGYGQDQIASMMGLLGTVAGYLLGKELPASKPDQPAAADRPANPAPQ